MRFSVVLKFARILMVSRLRSVRESFVSRSITGKPTLIIILGTAMFVASSVAGLALVWFLQIGIRNQEEIQQFVANIIGGSPIFVMGFYFTMGLLWELNASTEAESTDTINWLPISPGEYVAASSLSTGYTYSPALMAVLGFSLPVTLYSNHLATLSLLVPLLLVSAGTGSVGVEILRSGLARTASAFGRTGGRTMIVLRILGIVSILILTQILFSGFIIARIIGTLVANTDVANFVPLLWPTLSLTRSLNADFLSSVFYLGLDLGFLALLVKVALFLRARYWVVFPFRLRLSGLSSISRPGRLARIGVGPRFVALLNREVRSATRRKEVVRMAVIPVIIPIMIGFPFLLSPIPSPSVAGDRSFVSAILGIPFLLGVSLGALLLSMTSLGQEGRSLWNLASLPLEPSALVLAKATFASLVSLIGLAFGAVGTVLVFGFSLASLFGFIVVGLTLIVLEVCLGLAVGSRFPDFSEGPRPKFITVTGSIIGTVAGLLSMALTVSPIFVGLGLNSLYGVELPFALYLATSVAVGLIAACVFYRLSIRPVTRFLSELPM